jgi:hypothetical protein
VRNALVGAAGCALAVAGAGGPARASSSGPVQAKPAQLAGYDVAAVIASGSASFTVPKVTCTSGDQTGVGIGLGVEEAAGAPTSLANVFVVCLGPGRPYYEMNAIANGVRGAGSSRVSPGDKIEVSYEADRRTLKVKVKNVTKQTTSTAIGFPPPDDHLTFGAFPLYALGSGPWPVPDFGKTTLTKVKANSKKVKRATAERVVDNPAVKVGKLKKGAFALRYRG